MATQRGITKHEKRRSGPYVLIPYNRETHIQRARRFTILRECQSGSGDYVYPSRRAVRTVTGYEEAMDTARALFFIERKIIASEAGHDKPFDVSLTERDSCSSFHSRITRRWHLGSDIDRAIRDIVGGR